MGDAFDQAEGLRRLLGQGGMRSIAVLSAQSRTGNTSLVTHLAQALSDQGQTVLVIDEGIGEESGTVRLGQAAGIELAQVLKDQIPFAAAIRTVSDSLHVLPAREGLRRIAHLGPQAQARLLAQIRDWPVKPDLLLMDLAADRSRVTLSAAAAADGVLLALTPDPHAVTQCYALIKQLAKHYGVGQVQIVANKTKNDADAAAVYNNMSDAAQRYLDIRLTGLVPIPLDDQLKRANKLRQSVLAYCPDAPAGRALRRLARAIVDWPAHRAERGDLDAFLHRLIMSSRLTEMAARA